MTEAPVSGLDFLVEIRRPGQEAPLCAAAFAACDGIEVGVAVQRVREGGQRRGSRLLAGAATPGNVVLRRGVTTCLDLWDWVADVADDPSARAEATVALLGPDGAPRLSFALHGCLPVRLRGPRLDARDGAIAIEELELASESLEVVRRVARPPVAVQRAVLRAIDGPARLDVPSNPTAVHRARDRDGDHLRMTLHVDAPEGGDVRDVLAPLDELLGEPAARFTWGRSAFDGRLEEVVEVLEDFGADGRALRATVTLHLVASVAGGDARHRGG